MNWISDPTHRWVAAYRVAVLCILTFLAVGHHLFGVSVAPGCLPALEDVLGGPLP